MQAFEEAGKPANLRAEQLSLEELAGVFERLTSGSPETDTES